MNGRNVHRLNAARVGTAAKKTARNILDAVVGKEEAEKSAATPLSAESDGCGSADGAVSWFLTTKTNSGLY